MIAYVLVLKSKKTDRVGHILRYSAFKSHYAHQGLRDRLLCNAQHYQTVYYLYDRHSISIIDELRNSSNESTDKLDSG